jgi:hypothetical protein
MQDMSKTSQILHNNLLFLGIDAEAVLFLTVSIFYIFWVVSLVLHYLNIFSPLFVFSIFIVIKIFGLLLMRFLQVKDSDWFQVLKAVKFNYQLMRTIYLSYNNKVFIYAR